MSDQKNSLGMDSKTAGWFAYLFSVVSGIILLVVEKNNRTVRTHAWQSIIMGGFFVAVYIVLGILSAIFSPGLMNIMAWYGYYSTWSIIYLIVGLLWIVLTVICIIKALQGDIFKVPVIYNKVSKMK